MMSLAIVLHYLAALAYLGLGSSIWLALWQNKNLNQRPKILSLVLLGLIIAQGAGIHLSMLQGDSLHINWSLGLSFTLWLGLIIYWIESNFFKISGFLLLLLPIGFVVSLLVALFPISDNSTKITLNSTIFMVHLVISLFAYSLIALSALQALIMTSLDSYLHRPQHFTSEPTLLARALDAQPPLLVQERILFRLIWIGFFLLSLSIISGMIVSMQAHGSLLPNDHKTFFTLISWLIFGTLLIGRAIWGWRGRIALRWTLLGFGLLMLAYTGTRFIFEELITKG